MPRPLSTALFAGQALRVLSLIVMLVSALVVPGTLQAQPDSPVTLKLAMSAPADLDPVHVSRFDPDTRDLVENLFIGLTRFDPITRTVEPMLAQSWSVSPNGLTWTFQLREDVEWVRWNAESNSVEPVRPVVAGDFVYAIQRGCDPLRPSPLTSNLMIVDGCQTVASAFPEVITDLFIAREIGARAVGPNTLEIDLRFPASYFPTLLSTPEFRPLPREAIVAQEHWTAADTIMTNGPFALQSWTDGGLTLVRNPHWPGPNSGNIEQVSVTFASPDNMGPIVASGRADMARLAPELATAANITYRDLFHQAEGPSLIMLSFSFSEPLAAIPEVRRALAMAVDPQALADILPPGYMPAFGFTPTDVVASSVVTLPAANSAAAQDALAAAGFPSCSGIPGRITLTVRDDDPAWLAVGQAIIQQWTTALGCNAALFTLNTASRVTLIELSHANYDPEATTRPMIWMSTWSADYPDANAWLGDALHCQYGYLRLDRPCDQADALLDQAIMEFDLDARTALYAQVERLFFGPDGSFPVIPLATLQGAWLQQPHLDGVNAAGAARYDLWTLTAG